MTVTNCKITVVDFVRLYKELGSVRKVIRHVNMDESNFYKWKKRHQDEIDALPAVNPPIFIPAGMRGCVTTK